MISTFGCVNGLILSGARVSFAMARDGHFFSSLSRVNRAAVPGNALWLQAVWASLLVLTGNVQPAPEVRGLGGSASLRTARPRGAGASPETSRHAAAVSRAGISVAADRLCGGRVRPHRPSSARQPENDMARLPDPRLRRAGVFPLAARPAQGLVRPPVLFDLRDGALLVEFPELSDEEANRAAIALARRLRRLQVEDAIPAARSLLIVYDPLRVGREAIAASVERLAAEPGAAGADSDARLLRLPVLYDGEDLAELANRAGMPAAELVRRHAAERYRVAFIGFAPGFAYLAGLPPELAAPRLTSPRSRVPAGSVAIGGSWTGVYPSASPGGWRLLGRTSAVLFDAAANPPALLAPGDRVEFEAVRELTPRRPAGDSAPAPGRPGFRVLSPGLFTSIQGLPRPGLGSSGIPPGGAMDPLAFARANDIVGNAPGAPALEITLAGPELEALADIVVSERGKVRSGERIRFGRLETGARAYVAVAGGFVDPHRAREGTRRLVAGDILAIGAGETVPVRSRRTEPEPEPEPRPRTPTRFLSVSSRARKRRVSRRPSGIDSSRRRGASRPRATAEASGWTGSRCSIRRLPRSCPRGQCPERSRSRGAACPSSSAPTGRSPAATRGSRRSSGPTCGGWDRPGPALPSGFGPSIFETRPPRGAAAGSTISVP